MWGGEQMGTRDCPGLVLGAGNSSLASLAENSSIMSQNGYVEDTGEYTQVWVCVQRELLGQKPLGELVHPPGCPRHWPPVCGPLLMPGYLWGLPFRRLWCGQRGS